MVRSWEKKSRNRHEDCHLVIRRDLRLADNQAGEALRQAEGVPVFRPGPYPLSSEYVGQARWRSVDGRGNWIGLKQ